MMMVNLKIHPRSHYNLCLTSLPNSAISMESQPQNPELRIIPENFHPCSYYISQKANNKGVDQAVRMCRLVLHLCCLYATKSGFLRAWLI